MLGQVVLLLDDTDVERGRFRQMVGDRTADTPSADDCDIVLRHALLPE